MTGPLANEFAQVREALSMWLRGEPPQTAIGMGHGEVAAALARIEEHTHNTEKRIGWAIEEWLDAQGYNPLDSDAIAREILARAVLSAGEGTPA